MTELIIEGSILLVLAVIMFILIIIMKSAEKTVMKKYGMKFYSSGKGKRNNLMLGFLLLITGIYMILEGTGKI